MFDFLFEVHPSLNHAVGIFLMLGSASAFALIVLFTINRGDRHYKKTNKTKKA